MIEKVLNSNFYNNKTLLKGLKFASEKSPIFTAGISLAFEAAVRPISTLMAPKTDKEDKKLSCIKSLSSALTGFLFMLLFSTPFANAVKNIDKNPKNYLTKETIKNLSDGLDDVVQSKNYKFLTQLFKLGLGFLLAYPKAIINNAIIPKFVKNKKNEKEPSFTGKLENIIADTINSKTAQKISSYAKKTDYTTHLIALGDIFSTFAFMSVTNKNKKLDKHQKSVLNYNALVSTILCLTLGYGANKALNKPFDKFIKNLEAANKTSQDLMKYKEGASIIKTSLVFGLIYYCFIPFVSTYISSKIASKNSSGAELKNNL